MAGLTYTKIEIRRRVDHILREADGGGSVLSADAKNRIISDIHRDFVERTGCNRNWSIFSIAAEDSDGVSEHDEAAGTPTLVRVDVEGFNWYRLSSCDFVDRIERFTITSDGGFAPLALVNSWEVAAKNLLSGDAQYPGYYQMQGSGLFRLLPKLNATSGYPIKVRITYRQSVTDLIVADATPSLVADDTKVPTVPLKFRKALVYGAAADCMEIIDDARADRYRGVYEREIQRCKAEVHRDSTDAGPAIRMTRKSAGG